MTTYLIFFGGVIVGIFIGLFFKSLATKGTIKIDRHNPEKDIYRLEIDQLENLHKLKQITLKIDPNADLSQS